MGDRLIPQRARQAVKRALASPLVPEAVRARIHTLRTRQARASETTPDGSGPEPFVARRRTPEAERAGVMTTLEDEVRQVCFVEGHYPEGWPRHERCPCCESTETRYLFSKHDLAHSVCGACGFVFLDPYPTNALLDRIYNAAYYPGVRRFVELPKARAGQPAALFSFPEPVLERIIEHVRHPARSGTWLEVGGGVGAFASLAQARLPDWEVHLNELNHEAVAFAREAYGLRTVEGGPDVIAASGMQFDVISMIATLEHVPQPYELLSAFAPLLRPGGYLVIGVPRFSPLNRAISHDASASVTPPYHVSHFDEGNLALLLRRIDLLDDTDVVAWQDGPNAFKLIDLVKTWPYWRIEVPTTELDAPRSAMLEPYPEPMHRWVNALGAADELTGDLIHEIDGGLFLTMIAQRRGEAASG